MHVNNIVGSSPLAKSDQSQISLPGPYLFLKREVQPIVLERLQELSENADYRTRLCIALAFAIVFKIRRQSSTPTKYPSRQIPPLLRIIIIRPVSGVHGQGMYPNGVVYVESQSTHVGRNITR